jgi:hypothetical protein
MLTVFDGAAAIWILQLISWSPMNEPSATDSEACIPGKRSRCVGLLLFINRECILIFMQNKHSCSCMHTHLFNI